MNSELIVLYGIIVLWLTPWILLLIVMMYKFKRLSNKLEEFLEENLDDEREREE